MAFIAALIPADQEVTRVGAVGESMGVFMVRTASGFDVFEKQRGHRKAVGVITVDQKHPNLISQALGARPNAGTYDLADVLKALKPFDKEPTQTFTFGIKFTVEAKGKDLNVQMAGEKDIIVISPANAATTAPAATAADEEKMQIAAGIVALIPKDQAETVIAFNPSAEHTRVDTTLFVRVEDGFKILDLKGGLKWEESGARVKIDANNSNLFTFVEGRESRGSTDVTAMLRALKPFDKNPKQKVKFGPAWFSIEAKGKTLTVQISGVAEDDGTFTFVPGHEIPTTAPASAPASRPATAPSGEDARKIGKEFIADLAKADTDALGKHYAQGVAVLAGSELLKPEWGLDPDGDRSTALAVSRDDLMKAYGRLIAKSGKRWKKMFADLAEESMSTEFAAADKLPVTQRGDLLLTVKIGSDSLLYIFRQQASGKWEVVAERTDY
jgi:hypothetical protein